MAYIVLALSGAALFAAAWRRSGGPVMAGLFLVAGAVAQAADFIVHALFNLYVYHPGLFPTLPDDGPVGLILADYLFVPALASCLVAIPKQHRVTAGLLMAIAVLILEDLFIAAGLFENHGWRLTYSALLFPLYFGGLIWWIGWYSRAGYQGLRRLIVVAAGSGYLITMWGAVGGLLLGLWGIRPGLLPYDFPDLALGMLLHHLPAAVLVILAVIYRWSHRPAVYPAAFALLTVWFILLARAGLWQNAAVWHPALESLSLSLILYGAARLDRWMASELTRARS